MNPGDLIDLMPAQHTDKTPGRQRAPQRKGHRAQLTVPESMWRELTGLARVAGTTPNDVLIRLASERLRDRTRAVALRKRADQRWQAFADASSASSDTDVAAEPLSGDELVELSQAFREDS
jgi:predicted DNA-binding ribbon-helix-helix protein